MQSLSFSPFVSETGNVEEQPLDGRELFPRIHKDGEVEVKCGASHLLPKHVEEQQIPGGGSYEHVRDFRPSKETVNKFQDVEGRGVDGTFKADG